MDIGKIPLLSGLAARLDFLAARTTVIAENIANADTPDYIAKDIKKPDFRALTRSGTHTGAPAGPAMRVSDPRHIATAQSGPTAAYRTERTPDGEASLTGNQVSIETQAMKLSETRQEYALATSIYRKSLSMLRLAVRGQ